MGTTINFCSGSWNGGRNCINFDDNERFCNLHNKPVNYLVTCGEYATKREFPEPEDEMIRKYENR